MLSHLHIKNFALIKECHVDFTKGMAAITGETGSGKSILLDSIALILGERADFQKVRDKNQRTEITADFLLSPTHTAAIWLKENTLDNDNECLVRRSLSADGRSKNFINGHMVTLQQLKALGTQLLQMHGQHETHELLTKDYHRTILDIYGENQKALLTLEKNYQTLKSLQAEKDALLTLTGNQGDRKSLLQYQLTELDELDVQLNEVEDSHAQLKQLSSSNDIMQACQASLMLLDEDEEHNISLMLHKVKAHIEKFKLLDPHLASVIALIDSANVHLEEASEELRDYMDCFDSDPEQLAIIESRLEKIHDVARKHHVEAENLRDCHHALRNELDKLENSEEHLAALNTKIQALETKTIDIAKALSKKRKTQAKTLCKKINTHLHELNMPGAALEFQFTESTLSSTGLDTIEFLAKTNPGQPMQPLKKIASGGELSRIALAIQLIIAERSPQLPTLIFDEVDVGIGGPTAAIMGEKLKTLGEHAQVICVTHLPQIASLANAHYLVAKHSKNDETISSITYLDAKQREAEIARMLGGAKITQKTRDHARELLMS